MTFSQIHHGWKDEDELDEGLLVEVADKNGNVHTGHIQGYQEITTKALGNVRRRTRGWKS